MTRYQHHAVPYHSQWRSPELVADIVNQRIDACDDPRWVENGFVDPQQYRFWSGKLCGLACLESALDYWRIPHPPRHALLLQALSYGVYRMRDDGGVDGLIYQPFANWLADQFDLQVDVFGLHALAEIATRLDADTLAMASVSPEIRAPETPNARRGGHLVLLHGYDAQGVWFHNPSGIPPHQADAYLSYEMFARFYAQRGMTLRRR